MCTVSICLYKTMKQSSRLFFTLVYLVLLFALARFVTGFWFYLPSGDANTWFQVGLLMVVLGSFFIEQHFTKPVDVITNVAAGVITLLALENRETFLYWNYVLLVLIVLGVGAFLSMVIQTFLHSQKWQKFGSLLFTLTTFFGNAKRLFSVILFLAVFSYFQIPSLSALLVFIFWASVVVSEPIGLPRLFERLIDRFYSRESTVGRVWRIVGKNVVQIEMLTDLKLPTADVFEIKFGNEMMYCAPVGEFYLRDKRIITAIRIYDENIVDESLESIGITGIVNVIPESEVPERVKSAAPYVTRQTVLGFVDDNTTIEELRFKLLADHKLRAGHLIKVLVEGEPIIYQVVNAITKSDSHNGDEDRYVLVMAQQVGRWDEGKCRFSSTDWVPKPGSAVFAESKASIPNITIDGSRKTVGKLPNSEYPVHVEINDIVTHHTAVLGITGSGKTFLAYELIRKMVESGIKVLIFDVSADYARDLADLNPEKLTTTGDVTTFLNDATKTIAIAEFQPTAAATLVKATATAVQNVLAWAKTNLSSQQGENLKAKVCVVFEEAHSLIPEWNSVSVKGDTDEVNKVSQAILQGRKYGVGALVITQRTANITKTILNQCNTIFALQSFDQTGLEFLKNYIGEDHAHALSTLLPRHTVLFGKASSSRRPVIVRLTDSTVSAPVPDAVANVADGQETQS